MPEHTMIFGNIYNVGANIGGHKNCSVCPGICEWTRVDVDCSIPITKTTTTTTTTTTVKPEVPVD